MPDVRIDVYADTHGAPKNLKDVDAALDGVEKGAKKADGTMGGLWKQFAIGELAVKTLHKAYAVFKNLVVDSIKGAIDEEKAEKSLQAALEITGRTVRGNLKHYLDWAQAKSKVTLYTREEIQDAQTLLLTLVRLDQQGTDRAIKGAMGLATVTGIDLHSATMKIIAVMEGQYAGLSKVGIRVNENLTTEQKQASILEQLEKLYQRSTKETDTFGGSLSQLKKSWDELLETVGRAITDNETVRETVVKLREETDKLADSPGFKLWLDILVKTTVKVVETAAYAGKEIGKGILYSIDDIFRVTEAEKLLTEANIKLGIATARAAAAGHDYKTRMDAVTAAAKAAVPPINQTGNAIEDESNKVSELVKNLKTLADNTEATHPSIRKLETAFYNASESGTILNSKLRPIAEQLIELKVQTGEKVPTALLIFAGKLGETSVPLNRFRLTVESIELALFKLGFSGVGSVLKLGDSLLPASRNLDRLAAAMGHISPAWKKHLEDMKNKTQDTMSKIFGAISGVMSQIDGIYQQSANNRMLALDKEYQKRLDLIKSSIMSEEEKNKAIEGLDAEYSMKRRGVQRKAAEEGKLIAIFNATISVAEGIVKALSAAPPPWNSILAAITGALGAIQIGLIRAQPIPLAAGAIFKKPVFSGGYEAGEAGPEAVIPLSELPRLMREIGGGGDRGYQSERPIIIQNHIFLDSREMKSFTTKTVRESGRLGFLGRVGKEMA